MISSGITKMNYLSVCIVYISSSKESIVNKLKDITALENNVKLVHTFSDVHYDRTSFYFVGQTHHLTAELPSFISNAYEHLSSSLIALGDDNVIDTAVATHPAIGMIDNVAFSPLTDELSNVNQYATIFAQNVSKAEDVPVYAYGALTNMKKLQDIRRNLGYFNQNTLISIGTNSVKAYPPDYYSAAAATDTCDGTLAKGVMCVGSGQLIINFNIKFKNTINFKKVARITSLIREENVVEALTLRNGDYIEIATNLKDYRVRGCDDVLKKVNDICQDIHQEDGNVDCVVDSHYVTGPNIDELVNMYTKYL